MKQSLSYPIDAAWRVGYSKALTVTIVILVAQTPVLAGQKPPAPRRVDTNIVVPNNAEKTAAAFARDSLRRARAARLLAPESRRLADMYLLIPEYHDEQQFQIGPNDFGPMAYISASQFVGSYERVADIREQGKFGILAAIVRVEADSGTTLPREYTNLELRPGENCVWLANTTGQESNGWSAYVTPMSSPAGCVRPDSSARLPMLRVYRSTAAGFTFADYPAVARFGDAKPDPDGRYGQPLLGVKCLTGWCEIGPTFVVTPMAPESAGNGKEGKIKGYYDVQNLAYKDSTGVLRSAGRAVLEPIDNLDRLTQDHFNTVSANDTTGWVLVGRILFAADVPTNTKYYLWGLRKGANHLFLRRTGLNQWQMSVINPQQNIRYIWKNVKRERHTDIHVPGTARWRFADFDPMGVWVRCGEACCSGDGGSGS